MKEQNSPEVQGAKAGEDKNKAAHDQYATVRHSENKSPEIIIKRDLNQHCAFFRLCTKGLKDLGKDL